MLGQTLSKGIVYCCQLSFKKIQLSSCCAEMYFYKKSIKVNQDEKQAILIYSLLHISYVVTMQLLWMSGAMVFLASKSIPVFKRCAKKREFASKTWKLQDKPPSHIDWKWGLTHYCRIQYRTIQNLKGRFETPADCKLQTHPKSKPVSNFSAIHAYTL